MTSVKCLSFGNWLRGLIAAALAATVSSGCAHQQTNEEPSAAKKEINNLKSRIEELERTNGRLSVRLDEMEDEIFLLQDRVEAHRLALRRRNHMSGGSTSDSRRGSNEDDGRRGRYRVRNSGNEKAPKNGRQSPNGQPTGEHGYKRTVKRIPLNKSQTTGTRNRTSGSGSSKASSAESDSPGSSSSEQSPSSSEQSPDQRTEESEAAAGGSNSEESDSVVITDEDFRKFAQQNGSSKRAASNAGDQSSNAGDQSSKSSDAASNRSEGEGKKPQKRVTNETLPTGQKMDDEPRPSKADGTNPFEGKSGLEQYKTALAKYRSGEYATALEGFQGFLDGNPRKDYKDNGLYWIGECHYGMGDFRTAIEYFQRLMDEQPDGNKVPDAMLKMALAYRELDMSDKARKLLKKLTRRYPSTNAGRLGDKKLSDLES